MEIKLIGRNWFALAALLLGSPSVMATNNLYWCNGCNETYTAPLVGTGSTKIVYMGNIQNKTLHKYLVYWVSEDPRRNPDCEPDGGSCGHFATVNQTSSITQAEKQAFGSIVRFYYQAPIGWQKHQYFQIASSTNQSVRSARRVMQSRLITKDIQSAGDGGPYEVITNYPTPNSTVFDVVVQGPAQNNLLGWAGTNFVSSTYRDALESASLFHVVNLDSQPKLEWTIKFQDNSLISLVMDYSSSAHKWQIKPLSAYDSHNNSIPMNIDEIAHGPVGTREVFDFRNSSDDLSRFLNHLNLMGVTIAGKAQGAIIGCTRESVNGVNCTRFLQIP